MISQYQGNHWPFLAPRHPTASKTNVADHHGAQIILLDTDKDVVFTSPPQYSTLLCSHNAKANNFRLVHAHISRYDTTESVIVLQPQHRSGRRALKRQGQGDGHHQTNMTNLLISLTMQNRSLDRQYIARSVFQAFTQRIQRMCRMWKRGIQWSTASRPT